MMPKDLDNAEQDLFQSQMQAFLDQKPAVGEVKWAGR
jgi:hypothetical protein